MAAWVPKDEAVTRAAASLYHLIGSKAMADRYGKSQGTVRRWATGESIPRSKAHRRSLTRARLAERRKQMKQALVQKRRDELTTSVESGRGAVKTVAQRRLDEFEGAVKRGDFNRQFNERLRTARSSEDWRNVRAEYTDVRGRTR